jgi:hypothetical protein
MTSSSPEFQPSTAIHAEITSSHAWLPDFSGHPPCWGPSLSPHMGGRRYSSATEVSPEILQQDTGTVPCGAETPRGRRSAPHPAGRGHRRPSPMRQTPLPNRPINKCGTGACYSSEGEGKKREGLGGRVCVSTGVGVSED